MNLLVPSIGRKVALARLLKAALNKRGGRLIAADHSPYAAGLVAADAGAILPADRSEQYWPAVEALCRERKIDAVALVRDADLETWSRRFAEEGAPPSGIRWLSSPRETIRWCLDKWRTANRLAEAGLPHPKTCLGVEWLPDSIPLPAIVKPRRGAGGMGMARFDAVEDLAALVRSGGLDEGVVQEWVEGQEFSVDCYVGLDGAWRTGVVRCRRTTVGGQIDTGETVEDEELLSLARQMTDRFEFRGPVNIQIVRGSDGPCLIEVNPRFPGGMGLSAAAGIDLAELLVADASGEALHFPERPLHVRMLGYSDAFYVSQPESGQSKPQS